MKRTILYVIVGIILIAAVIGVVIWRRQAAQNGDEDTRSATVERGTLLVAVSASGSIEPQVDVDLTFETPGRVDGVQVSVGDRVAAGDCLAKLDTRQLDLQVQQAKAALALAQAQLAQLKAGARPEEIAAAEADLRAAQAQVDNAAATRDQVTDGATQAQIAAAEAQIAQAKLQYRLALQNYDRVRSNTDDEEQIEQASYDLYTAEKSLVAAQASLDDIQAGADRDDVRAAEANVEAATARRDAAQAQLDKLLAGATEEQIADAEAQVARARAGLEQALAALERAALYAPFDGIIAHVNVSAGEMAPVGRPAISLIDPSSLQVAISVDELDVGRLTVGQEAEVTLDALPDVTLDGTIARIAPAATISQGGVVYYDVIVLLAPTDAPVRADMTANVTIVVEEFNDVLTIPTWIVRVDRRTGQTYVHRKHQGETERVDVALGARYQGAVQVLSGLSEGEEIIWMPESRFEFGGSQ